MSSASTCYVSRRPVSGTLLAVTAFIIAALGTLAAPHAARATLSGWGYNGEGQVGDGVGDPHYQPFVVPGMAEPAVLSGGYDFSLVAMSDGTAWSWGGGLEGQLGNGTNSNQFSPAPISGLTDIVSVESGFAFGLAIHADGTVSSWGDNFYGQLGDGTNDDRNVPGLVPGLTGVVAVQGGGQHAMALKSDGTVWAWGNNGYGQLGDGTTTNQPSLVNVPTLSNVVAISIGRRHSLALLADGTLWAWGANDYGQIGDGSGLDAPTPIQVAGLSNVVSMAAGHSHSLALLSDGTAWSWGHNGYGQLGNGTFVDSPTPVQVLDETGTSALTGIVTVSAGLHSMALTTSGTLLAWGFNGYGACGDSTGFDLNLPIQVTCLFGVSRMVAADYHSLAIGLNHCEATVGVDASASAPATRLLSVRPDGSGGSSAEIAFNLERPGHVSLTLHDVQGRRVAQIAERWFDAGSWRVRWDGLEDGGARAASGIYLVSFVSGGAADTKKLLIIR